MTSPPLGGQSLTCCHVDVVVLAVGAGTSLLLVALLVLVVVLEENGIVVGAGSVIVDMPVVVSSGRSRRRRTTRKTLEPAAHARVVRSRRPPPPPSPRRGGSSSLVVAFSGRGRAVRIAGAREREDRAQLRRAIGAMARFCGRFTQAGGQAEEQEESSNLIAFSSRSKRFSSSSSVRMATASEQAPVQKKPAGLWNSLSPSEQKKAVTVFLCSLGVTLLITGRSGGKLLKRAKATEANSATADAVATSSAATRLKSATRPRPPPPPAPATTSTSASASAIPATAPTPPRPQAPPISFLHPNALTPPAQPRPRRRLLPSFILPSSPSPSPSVLPLSSRRRSPAPSSYFLPNPTIVARSTAFADELDKYDKLHEDGAPLPPPAAGEDDGFNPAWFAFKALAIATALSVGTFAAGIYGVMRYLGVDDVESLALSLQHRLPSVFDAHRPSLPDWATPSSSSQAESLPLEQGSSEIKDKEAEEEMSYWASVKETLDREAEENRRERRRAWEERVRQRASALGGGGGGVAGSQDRQG
ncbi:hypothetical protein RHOSPDRAFT_27242 [Rhodotorula sp. JG-1b]|nr:hypothetical protein RHOSPDRAFT_27242 [Rhodotorula sp. JG-1b]